MRRVEDGHFPLQIHSINDILSELMAQKGWGQTEARQKKRDLWKQVAEKFFPPAMVKFTNPGDIRNGRLTIFVNGNSVLVQELNFRKKELLECWNQAQNDLILRGLVFKQGK